MPKKVTSTKIKTAPRKTGKVKTAVKTTSKISVKAVRAENKSLETAVLGVDGRAKGKTTLPEEVFGAKVNKQLIAQAVRVYLTNQREGSASTKTRGEVEGSTRKIYRQKGTGRARHGAIRAPIFVGGGIVFGPKPRQIRLSLPEKMRKVALASALTLQYRQGNVLVVSGLEDLEPKTKAVAKALTAIGATKRTLIVLGQLNDNLVRGSRNIPQVEVIPATDINTYVTLASTKIVFSKDALGVLKQRFK